jgi:hypothetical protein
VEENPEERMPWNYADNLTGLGLAGYAGTWKRGDMVVVYG